MSSNKKRSIAAASVSEHKEEVPLFVSALDFKERKARFDAERERLIEKVIKRIQEVLRKAEVLDSISEITFSSHGRRLNVTETHGQWNWSLIDDAISTPPSSTNAHFVALAPLLSRAKEIGEVSDMIYDLRLCSIGGWFEVPLPVTAEASSTAKKTKSDSDASSDEEEEDSEDQ